MVYRWLLPLFFIALPLFSVAQIVPTFVENSSHREVTPDTDGCANPPLCDFYKMVSWNDSQIGQAAYQGRQGTANGPIVEFMNWRMVFPLNYDPERPVPYPMIVMLHGAGESGRLWSGRYNYATDDVRFDNNGANIIHGGQAHLNAVNRNPSLSNAFPGIVIWPQVSYNGAWESGWENGNLSQNGRMVASIIEYLITTKNIDPDRIYMHGLSNGGKGTWDLAAKRPDLFAAVLPMAGVGSNPAAMAPILNTMPLWLFQGGTDTNPNPQAAAESIAALQAQGGNPRYTLYPTLGHGVWNTAYGESDFFPWILAQNKKNIHVFGGDPNICPEGSIKLGFSANMLEYQWTLNDADIPGANTREYTTTTPGVYRVKFKRRFGPNEWIVSNSVTVGLNPSSFSPTLTSTGSTVLPTLGGVNEELYLNAPNGYPTYYWFKDGNLTTPIQPANSQTTVNTVLIKINQGSPAQAGDYTVQVLLPNGCRSEHSNVINVVYGTSGPSAPNITSVQAISPTQIEMAWSNVGGADNYEVWRYRPAAGGYFEQSYQLVSILPQDTQSFIDSGLRPGANYRYRMRATNSNGGGQYSNETAVTTTNEDTTPPTPPLNLAASNITDTQATLTWDIATDNDVLYAYEIYNGSTLLATLTHPYAAWSIWNSSTSYAVNDIVFHNNRSYRAKLANTNQLPVPPPAWSAYWEVLDVDLTDGNPHPPTTYTVTGLSPGTTYFFSVRALDFKNPNATDVERNYSPFAESVTVTTSPPLVNGLVYRFYRFTGNMPGPADGQLVEPQVNNNFNFNQTPTNTGNRNNFTITPMPDGGAVERFVYAFDGYIEILNAGTYTFYTSSDDGSRLYISTTSPLIANSTTLVVNNDGLHGTQERQGTFTFNSPGKYPIRVTFFEQTGGEALTVSYAGPSIAKTAIPNARLYRPSTFSTYYLRTGSDSPHLNTSWTTSSSGNGGSTPGSNVFTQANTHFVIANRSTVTLSTTWTVSGSGSKVIVGNGIMPITLDLDAELNAIVEANSDAIVNLNHSSIPQFGLMHTNSTVNFNVASVTVPNASYGNVSLAAAGLYNLPMNTTTVKGNLTLENGVITAGVVNNLSTLRVGGNLTFYNDSGSPFPLNGGQQFSLVFTGATNHLVSFANPVSLNLFSIQTDSGDDVVFNNLNGQTITVGSNQGGGLVLKGGATLNLGNNNLTITGRGTINANNETGSLFMDGGSLTFTTTATQNSNLYFAENSRVNNLTSSTPTNNRLSLLSNVLVDDLVMVNGGQLNTSEGNLTLRSVSDAANGTARIGPLLNGASVTGKIKVQRYMSGEGRIYRYISSPVAGVSAADLQEFFPITGNFAGASSGPGIISGNASMFHYAEPNYIQFPSVGGNNLETLQRGKGYVPFIREGSDSTVWEVMGEPHQGAIPFDLTGGTGSENDGWNLLGNPYPAPIQWGGAGWTSSGVNTVAYVRENSGSNTAVLTSGVNWDGVIAPGQAFWVRTTAGSPALTLNENAKTTTDGAFYREGAPNNQVKITMLNATYEDATVIHFADGATTSFDTELDGVKQDNTFFNLSSLTTDNKPMALNRTTPDYCTQEVKLRTTNAANGAYTLLIEGVENIISGDKVTFIDHFTNTEKTITGDEQYPFSITSDPASKADGRFVLRFEKPEVRLDMVLESFAACEQANPVIRITNAQPGVEYTAFHNGSAISEGIVAIENVLDLPVNPELVSYGNTQASLKAGFRSCNSFDLPQTILVHRDTLTLPEVSSYNNQVMASTENAQYVWYFEGEELLDETGRIIEYPLNGEYQVEVTLGSCTKISDPYIFVITSLETHTNENQPHPNPTKDKVVVTLEQPIALHTVRTVTVLGQVVQAPATPITEQSIEVNLSELPAGLYFLHVNERRYRIIKE